MRVTADDHLAWILARIGRLPLTEASLADSFGAILAEDVRAQHALPLWDNSAMDGYALHAADIAGASEATPVRLRVAGEVLAGSAEDPTIARGTAVRIMTGAPVPTDADAVIPVEATTGDRAGSAWAEAEVRVLGTVGIGANIRRAGDDTPLGALLAAAGDRLGAARIAALAAAGIDRVTRSRSPRIAVMATGSELRGPGETLERGQIPESNSLLITGLLRELGIEPALVSRSVDDAEALSAWFAAHADQFDCIITTGGVGPGTHDIVRLALADEPEVREVRVAVRPGQPQCAGRLGAGPKSSSGAFVFALPGNPVSAAVSFELFVRPALLALQGATRVQRLRIPAVADAPWRGARDRLQVMPVVVSPGAAGGLHCAPAVNPRGVSHAVGGHGAANGYALVPEGVGDIAAGDSVDVMLVGQ